MTPPLILVTNDDGIHSPGLHAALSALSGLGELLIVAPSEQQSGMGRSLPSQFDGRIHAIELEHNGQTFPAYHLAGSPAQTVLYGVLQVAPRRPQLVVSGINYGENLGSNVLISGTVGAALQGGDMGIPSLALSLETRHDYHYNHGSDVDWSAAMIWLRRFAGQALHGAPWPPNVAALKIDIPKDATPATPWRLTRQSRQSYYITRPVTTPNARLGYEIAIDRAALEPDSDIYAFSVARVISVTPLGLDLTPTISFPHFAAALHDGAFASPTP
ncbi:MAG: 5'/3'-nucleotidase SurE [Caldilineales bacterium]|nr:5'/3'-nucleotidase SurE [Caldilineales bacterium]